jgi:hypothetical protein
MSVSHPQVGVTRISSLIELTKTPPLAQPARSICTGQNLQSHVIGAQNRAGLRTVAADHDQIVFSGFAEDAFYWRGGGANADLVGDLQAAQGSRGFLEMGAGEEARFGRFRGDVEQRDGRAQKARQPAADVHVDLTRLAARVRDSLVFQVLAAARRRVEHRFLPHHLQSPSQSAMCAAQPGSVRSDEETC